MKKLVILTHRAKAMYFALALALVLAFAATPARADGTDPTTDLVTAATGYITQMSTAAKTILIAAFGLGILFTVFKVIRKGTAKV